MPCTSRPEVPSRLSRQYGAAGSRGRYNPVTRSLARVPVRLSGNVSTVPTARCSTAAVLAGSATGIARPGRCGPGQCPEVSRTWLVTPPSIAAWSSGDWLVPWGLGNASWSDQRALSIPKRTPPSAAATEERMTRASASAWAVPICPLIAIVASATPASRRCSAAGSALAPNPASPTVTIVEVRMASSRLAGNRRAQRSLRSTNDARAPRAFPGGSGPGGVRSARRPRLLLMLPTLRSGGWITSGGQQWLPVWRAIVAGTKAPLLALDAQTVTVC